MFDAARRVIKRDLFNCRVFAKESAALIKSHGVRENAPHLGQLHFRSGDEIVSDPEPMLAMDEQGVLKQQIEMLGDGTRKCVLDGNHGCLSSL